MGGTFLFIVNALGKGFGFGCGGAVGWLGGMVVECSEV